MKRFFLPLILVFFFSANLFKASAQYNFEKEKNQYVLKSMKLLQAVKEKGDYQPYVKAYEQIELNALGDALKTDQEIKAFWINTYNAFVQIFLTEDPSLFDDRGDFFKKDRIQIGQEKFSFDFIEHGIIRGSKIKLSMGFLKDPFAGDLEKKFRVENTDGRIHFALNCGAKSCPYIAIYSAVNLNAELDAIAQQFLKRTTTFNAKEGEVYVTTLFSWFKGDFSDEGGVIGFLHKYQVIPQNADPKVNYKEYDWTLDLGNYTVLSTNE